VAEELSAIIPNALERRVRELLERAKEAELSIAAAESCTGGLLSSLLTDVEGASSAFERGFVVYSVEAKCDLLGIARERIDRCGAVSREVALAMVDGALEHSKADVALAITGFAGQAGPGDEPGLVHLACRRRGLPAAHREEHFGDVGRGDVRIAAVTVAIAMLERALSDVA
jgi:nicotinamide-nucleotide amidase